MYNDKAVIGVLQENVSKNTQKWVKCMILKAGVFVSSCSPITLIYWVAIKQEERIV